MTFACGNAAITVTMTLGDKKRIMQIVVIQKVFWNKCLGRRDAEWQKFSPGSAVGVDSIMSPLIGLSAISLSNLICLFIILPFPGPARFPSNSPMTWILAILSGGVSLTNVDQPGLLHDLGPQPQSNIDHPFSGIAESLQLDTAVVHAG